ncbi:hypothetical protein HS088_TW01G00700 [Tripterygium wilfordii]|uniref:Senescence regulator n=1 Tax=Tripterygium wilfordii TaxID=458696 RepID=A0A7J7E292_TRIWF|nr:uncharacterized protein LOC120003352 [Tripterygium wilfordii]KAF5752782.1 hypothetical protein HS088_TW01G00700 [Tripterygium wilfordii]
MAEEFQESEVIFVHDCHKTTTYDEEEEEDANQYFNVFTRHNLCASGAAQKNNKKSKKKSISSSEPVNIPDMALRFAYGDEIEDAEVVVPPHVIVGRRIAGKMAFSVCTGNGRTLKGRDLSQVRNSILRRTGFLEPEAA